MVWECSLYAIKVQSHPSVFSLNVEPNDAYKIESPRANADSLSLKGRRGHISLAVSHIKLVFIKVNRRKYIYHYIIIL